MAMSVGVAGRLDRLRTASSVLRGTEDIWLSDRLESHKMLTIRNSA